MLNIKVLLQREADLKKQAHTILKAAGEREPVGLNDEERTELDKFEAELKTVGADIQRVRQFQREEQAAGAEEKPANGDAPKLSFGEFLQFAAIRGGYPHTDRLFRFNPKLEAAASGLSEAVPSDGGFLVEKDIEQGIITQIHDMGQLISRVRRVPVNGNGLVSRAIDESSRADGSRWGGVQAYWAHESDTVTASKPKFRRMEQTLNKLFAIFYSTDELLEDASALEAEASQAFTEELTFKAEDAIFRGDGAGKPAGIMNAASLISVAKETSQAAATVLSQNISKMWARLPARSKMSAVWLINVDVEPQLDALFVAVKNVAGAENVGGFQPNVISRAADGGLLLKGRPVVPVEYCETLGTKGDIMLSDLTQYKVIEKASGLQAASSMHVRFLNDEMTFRFTWRLDGQAIWSKALTPYKGSNTQSPFVVLDTRA